MAFYNNIKRKIFTDIVFPLHWLEEGIAKPNVIAKNNALSICTQMHEKYNLKPTRIASTKAEGIYIAYDRNDAKGSRTFSIEAYNDAEIGVIVTDNRKKEILYNEDIIEMNFHQAIKIFKQNS